MVFPRFDNLCNRDIFSKKIPIISKIQMNRFFDENLIKLKIGKKKLQIEKRANEHNRTEKQQRKTKQLN